MQRGRFADRYTRAAKTWVSLEVESRTFMLL